MSDLFEKLQATEHGTLMQCSVCGAMSVERENEPLKICWQCRTCRHCL